MDVADAIVGLVHIAHGQVVREVHDGRLDRLLDVFQPNEVFHRLAENDHGVFGLAWCGLGRCIIIVLLHWLSAHVVEVGYLDTEQGLLALIELDNILALDAIVGGHEESLESLALELLLFLPEVVLDLRLLDSGESLSLRSLALLFGLFGLRCVAAQFGILSFDGEKAGVLLVPEGLDRDAVRADLKLHEVIHVNVIDVDLGIRNGNGWEWDLVRKNGELLSVRVECDFFDLSDLLPIPDFKLSCDTQLLVLAS